MPLAVRRGVRCALVALAALAATTATAAPAAGRYDLVDGRSAARITVAGPVGDAAAALPASGALAIAADGQVEGGEIVFDVAAMRADPLVAGQLRGPEGFDVARNPTARLAVTGGAFVGDRLRLEGRLLARGSEGPLVLQGDVVRARGKRFTAVLEGAFDRTAFGIVAGRPIYARRAAVSLRIVAAWSATPAPAARP